MSERGRKPQSREVEEILASIRQLIDASLRADPTDVPPREPTPLVLTPGLRARDGKTAQEVLLLKPQDAVEPEGRHDRTRGLDGSASAVEGEAAPLVLQTVAEPIRAPDDVAAPAREPSPDPANGATGDALHRLIRDILAAELAQLRGERVAIQVRSRVRRELRRIARRRGRSPGPSRRP